MRTGLCVFVLALSLSPAASGQSWEFGGVGGGSFFTSKTVTNGSRTATAGFKPGYSGGAILGQTKGRIGGEIRYLYARNEMKIASGGAEHTFGGHTHTIHYDFLLYANDKESSVRPYVAFGGGIRAYQGTGTEVVAQPLGTFALLTKTTDARPVISLGAGVKWAPSARVSMRVEFRDYLTPFPKGVIAPNVNSQVGGWIHDFVPMVGVLFGL